MPEVIRPSSIDPDAAPPRRTLVARVFDALKRPDVKVESYRLKKALLAGDEAAIVKSARNLSGDERLAVLEQVAEIRKSGAGLPADPSRAVPAGPTKINWARGRLRPAQPAQQQAPAPAPMIYALGDGPVRRTFHPTRGAVVHFQVGDVIQTGKLLDWGSSGAIVVTRDGEYTVAWKVLGEGPHPEQREEHDVLKSARAADRHHEYQVNTIALLCMDPATRAAWFAARYGDLP